MPSVFAGLMRPESTQRETVRRSTPSAAPASLEVNNPDVGSRTLLLVVAAAGSAAAAATGASVEWAGPLGELAREGRLLRARFALWDRLISALFSPVAVDLVEVLQDVASSLDGAARDAEMAGDLCIPGCGVVLRGAHRSAGIGPDDARDGLRVDPLPPAQRGGCAQRSPQLLDCNERRG